MQRHRVVDAIGNFGAFQLSDKIVAVVCQHCVLCVGTGVAVCDFLRYNFCAVCKMAGRALRRTDVAVVFCKKLVVLVGVLATLL